MPLVARHILVFAACAACLSTALAQRVLHLCDCPAQMAREEREQLLAEFRKLGYAQGKGLELSTFDVEGAQGNWTAVLQRELAVKPALILASGVRIAQAAGQTATDIPVVFWRLTDPVCFGLVSSLSRPGGNMTGFSRGIENLTPKRLELLHEMLPGARRVAFVFIRDNPSHSRQAALVLAQARTLGLEVRDYGMARDAWSEPALEDAFARMRGDGVDAFLLPDLNFNILTLVQLSEKYRLPTIYSLTHVVTDFGGIAAYATADSLDMHDVVDYANRILKGTKPALLPVQQPSRFDLVLNTRAARAMNVVFPTLFLVRATEVVDR